MAVPPYAAATAVKCTPKRKSPELSEDSSIASSTHSVEAARLALKYVEFHQKVAQYLANFNATKTSLQEGVQRLEGELAEAQRMLAGCDLLHRRHILLFPKLVELTDSTDPKEQVEILRKKKAEVCAWIDAMVGEQAGQLSDETLSQAVGATELKASSSSSGDGGEEESSDEIILVPFTPKAITKNWDRMLGISKLALVDALGSRAACTRFATLKWYCTQIRRSAFEADLGTVPVVTMWVVLCTLIKHCFPKQRQLVKLESSAFKELLPHWVSLCEVLKISKSSVAQVLFLALVKDNVKAVDYEGYRSKVDAILGDMPPDHWLSCVNFPPRPTLSCFKRHRITFKPTANIHAFGNPN